MVFSEIYQSCLKCLKLSAIFEQGGDPLNGTVLPLFNQSSPVYLNKEESLLMVVLPLFNQSSPVYLNKEESLLMVQYFPYLTSLDLYI